MFSFEPRCHGDRGSRIAEVDLDVSGQRQSLVVGKLHASCATTVGAGNFLKSAITCNGAAVLRDGTLTWQAAFKVGAPAVNGAITGGTGAYANARGVLTSKEDRSGTHDTITLAG